MNHHAAVVWALTLTLFIFGSSEAAAQQATSFRQLQILVKAGDTVSVTESSGKVSKGKITELSDSSVRLLENGVARELSEADVLEIKQRRSDSLANGARNGAIAGAAFGVLYAVGICYMAQCRNVGAPALIVGFTTGLGAGISVGIDALIVRQQTIYRAGGRKSSTRIGVTPFLWGDRKGVLLSLRF